MLIKDLIVVKCPSKEQNEKRRIKSLILNHQFK
jgi:hypothetical protein